MTSLLDSSMAINIKNDLIKRLPNFINGIGAANYLVLCNSLYEFSLKNQKNSLNEFIANINSYIDAVNNAHPPKTHKPIELLDVYCNALPSSGSDSSIEKLRNMITILITNPKYKESLQQFIANLLIQVESDTIKHISRDKKILWFINTLINVINSKNGTIDGSISIPKFQHIIPNIKDKCLSTVNEQHCNKLSKKTINSIIGLFVFLLLIIIFLLMSKK